MTNPLPAAEVRQPLSLRFAADPDLVEGILAVAQDWADRQEIPRDDGLSLRLVLEELIINVCRHAGLPSSASRVSLRLDLAPSPDEPARPEDGRSGFVRITLSDAGKPFNPLSFTAEPVGGVDDTPVGGRGLTLVRLLTSEAGYRRTGGENVLSLVLPLAGRTRAAGGVDFRPAGPAACGFCDGLRALWSGSLAVRQTVLFTLCSVALIWGAMGVYLLDVGREQSRAATTLATQAMHSQAAISSNFVNRVGITVDQVATTLRAMPDLPRIAADGDLLVERLRSNAQFRSLMAEIPVIGLAVGHNGTTRLYRIRDGEVHGADFDRDLSPFVASGGTPRWQSVFIPFEESGPHAAMLYGAPLAASNAPADGWIGAIITMPWIANALHVIGGFSNSVPFLVDQTGHYTIYPVGRRLGEGPQSLADEARQFDAPGLVDIERRILAGEKGVTQLRRVFGGDATPWPLPWQGATSLAFYPMSPAGWYLGLLISSDELGDAPQPLPFEFFLLAVLGPLVIAGVTWFITSRTLRPVRDLASALERFGGGDMDAPFPTAPIADEIGRMLTTFERVRVTLRASFRNLVSSAAAQERILGELGLARDIQTSMLPAVFPQLPWVKVHARLDMSREVCGDLHDCFALSDDQSSRICCVIGDVCGKGVAAAIVMSRTISLARAFLMEGLTPDETLVRLNEALVRANNWMMFVTMLVGVLDADGTFSWASAGHPPPLVGPRPGSGPAGEEARLPWSGELVLGVRGGQRYSASSLRLAPGQSLLLYTDGADEAFGPPAESGTDHPELYGEARLAASFAAACRVAGPAGPEDIVTRLAADLSAHMAGRPLADDISLMTVTYAGTVPEAIA